MAVILTSLYRALAGEPKDLYLPRTALRVPQNIPYLVDNLWEWMRPADNPSRRRAVFASPYPRMAARLANAAKPGVYHVPYHVVLLAPCPVLGLIGYCDAGLHPDVQELPRILMQQLGRVWNEQPLAQKMVLASLFLPCAKREEVANTLGCPEFHDLAVALRTASHYWNDVQFISPADCIEGDAECFFVPPRDGYRLLPLSPEEDYALWLDNFPNRDPHVAPPGLVQWLKEAEREGKLVCTGEPMTGEELLSFLCCDAPDAEGAENLISKSRVNPPDEDEE